MVEHRASKCGQPRKQESSHLGGYVIAVGEGDVEELMCIYARQADEHARDVTHVHPTPADDRHTVGGGVERVAPARTGQVFRGEQNDPTR
jgi:hypothetical protein